MVEAQQEKIYQALQDWRDWEGHWILAFNEKEKMMFCWIEKVGCSRFKTLFGNLHKKGSGMEFRLNEIVNRKNKESYKTLMKDPSVHKAIFYREPLERFLSGYLNKCYDRSRHYCVLVFGAQYVSFEDAVMQMPGKDPTKMDWHFMPQHRHCGGLTRELLEVIYTTVEPLQDEANTRESARKMLSKFQLTEQYFETVYPSSKSAHATDSSKRLQEYYKDPQLVAVIVKFFLKDYITFSISVPDFAQKALHELRVTNDPHALSDEEMKALGLPVGVGRSAASPLTVGDDISSGIPLTAPRDTAAAAIAAHGRPRIGVVTVKVVAFLFLFGVIVWWSCRRRKPRKMAMPSLSLRTLRTMRRRRRQSKVATA